MHSFHLRDFNIPKGPNLFALSVGEVIWFSLAAFFFILSWMIGGDDFRDSLGGYVGLAVLLGGVVLGAILCAVTKPE